MSDLGQRAQAVFGTGGIADSFEGVVILLMAHVHHKHGPSLEGAEVITILAIPLK